MPSLTTNEILFECIVKEHYRYICNFVARYTGDFWTAEEITQDTFVEAHKNIDNLKNHPNVRAWLTKTAIYNIHDSNRTRRKDKKVSFFADLGQSPSYYDTYDAIEALDLKRELTKHLKPKEAQIVFMFYKEKIPIKDISISLKISESNCKTILHRARKKLDKKSIRDIFRNM